MYVTPHGGGCCGVKHIFALGSSPESAMGPVAGLEKPLPNLIWPHPTSYFVTRKGADGLNIYMTTEERRDRIDHPIRPAEEAGERFDAALYENFLGNPKFTQLIEVTIQKNYQARWRQFLKKRGFFMAAEWRNSNSGNVDQLWVLDLSDKEARKKAESVVKEPKNPSQVYRTPAQREHLKKMEELKKAGKVYNPFGRG